MLLVVLDHARIGPFHGGFIGVDVFFVISGFLITGLLLGEAERRGRVSLLDFYARRAKRILPAATLVLARDRAWRRYFLLSGVAAIRVFKDTIWATFFAANIKFAHDETDYWAQDDAISPDPALLVAGGRGAVLPGVAADRAGAGLALPQPWPRPPRRRAGHRGDQPGVVRVRRSTASTNPRGAYFSTLARAWELGLGRARRPPCSAAAKAATSVCWPPRRGWAWR